MRNIGLPSDAFLGVVPTRRDERQRLGDIVFRRRKAGASSSCVAKLCRNVCGVTRRQLHRWTTAVNVKLLLPPRQSRGTSPGRLGEKIGSPTEIRPIEWRARKRLTTLVTDLGLRTTASE